MNELIENLDKLHITESGIKHIRKNLSLWYVNDIVSWCKNKITSTHSKIKKDGKNWHIIADNCRITVTASHYTIVTANRLK